MTFRFLFTPEAKSQLSELKENPAFASPFKAVKKALALMEANLRHPSLNTHKFHSLRGHRGEEIFETYAQQRTPGAYRIFWHYGPSKGEITVVSISSHP